MDGQSVILLDTHVLVWWVDGERKKTVAQSGSGAAATRQAQRASRVEHQLLRDRDP
jgi:PIN domain nuclease of toxin-antitoxin system